MTKRWKLCKLKRPAFIAHIFGSGKKNMVKREWLVDGQIHNGAHFPLCVFTNNARARSAEKAAERARRKGHGAKGKSMRSAKGIGKSKAKNEFGELPPPELCVLPDTLGQHRWGPYTQPS